MLYKKTEWDGRGSGESRLYEDLASALSERECVLTLHMAVKKYGNDHFKGMDVKYTTIESYTSRKKMINGEAKSSRIWY